MAVNKTIYDQRTKIDDQLRKSAPLLFEALQNLLDAVEERPALAQSIESATLQQARQLLVNLRKGGGGDE